MRRGARRRDRFLSHLLRGITYPLPPPTGGLATPHILAIPHNNLLSSSLGGLALLHLLACILHLALPHVSRPLDLSLLPFLLPSRGIHSFSRALHYARVLVRAHIVRSKDTRMCGRTPATSYRGRYYRGKTSVRRSRHTTYVTSANADIFCV